MTEKNFEKQKFYLQELKSYIKNFTVNFKKRYDIFPWKAFNKIGKEYYNEEVTISGAKFTVKSLIKEVNKSKTSIISKLKPSYYNFILRSYIKDAKNLEEKDLKKIYQNYKAEIDKEIKQAKLDLEFSILALKELTKILKGKSEPMLESTKDKIDTLIFDFGGVLVKGVMLKGRRDLFGNINLSDKDLDEFINAYFKHGGEYEGCSYEDAKILYKTYLPERLHKYINKVFDVVFGTTVPFDYSVPLIQSLKEAGYKLYYLSNWNKTGFELCKKNGSFPFIKYFDGGIVSYEVGLLKPDKKIYELLIEKYGINPKSTMFYDDNKENVSAARSVGLNATVFTQKTVKEIMDMTKFVQEAAIDVVPKNDSIRAVYTFLKKYGVTNVSVLVTSNGSSSSIEIIGDYKGKTYIDSKLGDVVEDSSKIDAAKSRILEILKKDKKMTPEKMNIITIKKDGSVVFKYDAKNCKTNKYKKEWRNLNMPKVTNEKPNAVTERAVFLGSDNVVYDLNDMLLETALDLLYEDDETEDDPVTEGANIDYLKIVKTYKSEYKTELKKFKGLMKNKDFNGARKCLDKAADIVNHMKKEIESIDNDSLTSAVIALIITSVITFIKHLLVMIIPVVGIPASSIAVYNDMMKDSATLLNQTKNKTKDVDRGDFNKFRIKAGSLCAKLSKRIEGLKDYVDKKEKDIKEIEKEQKKKVNVRESTEYKEKKLSIYESCQKGEITIEEREELLADMDREFLLKECEDIQHISLSNREKYKGVVNALYEKCSEGEITVEEREYLINKARDQFFESCDKKESVGGNNDDGIDPKQEAEAKKLEAEMKKAGDKPVVNE